MSTAPTSPPYPPQTWGVELPEGFGRGDIESLLQNILQKLSECIVARCSNALSPYPQDTGAPLTLSDTTQSVLQQYVQWTVPTGGGSTSISFLVNSPIIPLEIYGCATLVSSNSVSYPLGYNQGGTSLMAYFSNNNVNITAAPSLEGYIVTVVVRYVYYANAS